MIKPQNPVLELCICERDDTQYLPFLKSSKGIICNAATRLDLHMRTAKGLLLTESICSSMCPPDQILSLNALLSGAELKWCCRCIADHPFCVSSLLHKTQPGNPKHLCWSAQGMKHKS